MARIAPSIVAYDPLDLLADLAKVEAKRSSNQLVCWPIGPLSSLVDAVLFSVLREVSRLPKILAAYERMAGLGIPLLGAIVSGEEGDSYAGEYRYALRSRDPN